MWRCPQDENHDRFYANVIVDECWIVSATDELILHAGYRSRELDPDDDQRECAICGAQAELCQK